MRISKLKIQNYKISLNRCNLRPKFSNWRDRYKKHYTAAVVVLTNLSIPMTIKLYGEEELALVMKEMHQLYEKEV